MAYIDYYKILGVEKTATQAQIKTAYRKSARENHPDLNANDPNAEKKFKEINEANEVLSNSKNRTKYDKHGENWKYADKRANQSNYSDFFDSMFGGSQEKVKVKGQNFRTEASLNLTDILKAQERTLTLGGKNIRFTVPAGVSDNQTIKVVGHGGDGLNRGPKGDLYIKFRISNNTKFERNGNDLHLIYDLDLYTAMLGGEVTIETLTGKEKLKIEPETTNEGSVLLEGKGMPFYKNEEESGNLLVGFNIITPKNLSKKEKELFEDLAKLRSE